jgi:hypothetical protein
MQARLGMSLGQNLIESAQNGLQLYSHIQRLHSSMKKLPEEDHHEIPGSLCLAFECVSYCLLKISAPETTNGYRQQCQL